MQHDVHIEQRKNGGILAETEVQIVLARYVIISSSTHSFRGSRSARRLARVRASIGSEHYNTHKQRRRRLGCIPPLHTHRQLDMRKLVSPYRGKVGEITGDLSLAMQQSKRTPQKMILVEADYE